jgi:hypothetical protein
LHLVEHRGQELGRDLENAVRGEGIGPFPRGTDMVQREDHAEALSIGRKQEVSARMVEARHCRLHHGDLYLSHDVLPPRPSTNSFARMVSSAIFCDRGPLQDQLPRLWPVAQKIRARLFAR